MENGSKKTKRRSPDYAFKVNLIKVIAMTLISAVFGANFLTTIAVMVGADFVVWIIVNWVRARKSRLDVSES